MNPGIYDMPASEYHADTDGPTLSSSISKILLAKTAMHAWLAHPKLNPDYKHDDDSKFDVGTAAHALFLEGENCMEIIDAPDWRTKAAREKRDAARLNGKIPVLQEKYTDVLEMANAATAAIHNCDDLSGMSMNDGGTEQTVFFDIAGTQCRSRLDWLANDRSIILDYKTTENAAPETCLRQILNLGYDIQAAFYKLAVQSVTEKNPEFVFLFQEVEKPYACSLIGMPPAFIELGSRKVAIAAAMWEKCMKTGEWPGYGKRIFWAEPPIYAVARWDEYEYSRLADAA